MTDFKDRTTPCDIYIITTNDNWPVKIGIAKNCEARLMDLQISHWKKLRIFGRFKYSKRTWAKKVEFRSHGLLISNGLKLRGEWFNTTPEQAKTFIAAASVFAGVGLPTFILEQNGSEYGTKLDKSSEIKYNINIITNRHF